MKKKVKPQRGTMKLTRGGSSKREDHSLVWLGCHRCGGDVLVPADTGKVTCGWCVQRELAQAATAKKGK
jgi:hypothetical protein